jgi:hypothetical protein
MDMAEFTATDCPLAPSPESRYQLVANHLSIDPEIGPVGSLFAGTNRLLASTLIALAHDTTPHASSGLAVGVGISSREKAKPSSPQWAGKGPTGSRKQSGSPQSLSRARKSA